MLQCLPEWCTPATKSFLDELKVGDVVNLCSYRDGIIYRLPTEVRSIGRDTLYFWQVQVSRLTGHSNLKRVIREERLFWVEKLGNVLDVRSGVCLAPPLTVERSWWLHNLKQGDTVRYWRTDSGLTKDLQFAVKTITRIAQREIWMQPQGGERSGSVQVRHRTGFAKSKTAWIESLHEPTDLGDRLALLERQLPLNDFMTKSIEFNDRRSW